MISFGTFRRVVGGTLYSVAILLRETIVKSSEGGLGLGEDALAMGYWIASNACLPRWTAARMASADLVQTNGLGLSLASAMKPLMAVCSSTIEVKTPRLSRFRVSLANQPSTALAQEHEVGVKWKVTRGWRASQ